MRHERREPLGRKVRAQRRRILRVDGLGVAAPRIAREERKRVSPNRRSLAPHVREPLCGGKMASDVQHSVTLALPS